jgi:hypothetical protein
MRTFLAGLLDRTLPNTRPDESFFSAGPVRTTTHAAKSSGRPSLSVQRPRSQPAHSGLSRHRHA